MKSISNNTKQNLCNSELIKKDNISGNIVIHTKYQQYIYLKVLKIFAHYSNSKLTLNQYCISVLLPIFFDKILTHSKTVVNLQETYKKRGCKVDKLDILNREAFVEQLFQMIENISENKSSTCFALNGVWGCGKTFVLDMLQKKLESPSSFENETYKKEFFVIRYDSWKFDYYDEPLIAIVSSLINTIEEKTKLFSDIKEKHVILGMLKATGVTLLSIANNILKEKTGLDIQEAAKIVLDGKKEGAEVYENEHDYDAYFNFNKIMTELSDIIQSLAEKYTIIFMMDELDRCLPEYAIKVLERLHHLTENKSNIITVITMDKEQLMSSVKQIFGFNNPVKYLEKFISFEVKLDYGQVSEKITDKYADYIGLFDKDIFVFNEPIEECIQAIFKDIDIRSQQQLVQKAMLAHNLLYKDKKDYSFMCMELLLVVMICVYHDQSCFNNTTINISSFDKIFTPSRDSIRPPFVEFFQDKFDKVSLNKDNRIYINPVRYLLSEIPNLYGAILYTWYNMHKPNSQVSIIYEQGGKYEQISKNHEELKKYAEFIRMIS